MRQCRKFTLLVLLAPWLVLASCRPAPTIRTTQSNNPSRVAKLTTTPALRPAAHLERADPEFTHYVTTDTALLRRGDSDSDVIYDTIPAGSRIRMLRANEPYVRVITEDGRDGLVLPDRLKKIARSIIRPIPLHPTPVLGWEVPPIPPSRPAYVSLLRTRSPDQIEAAIDKACKYLASQQLQDGGWDIPTRDGQPMTRWQTALIAGTLAAVQGDMFKMRDRAKAALADENESETFTLSFRDDVFRGRNSVERHQGAMTLLRAAMTRDTKVHHNLADTLFGDWIDSDASDPINSYFAFSAILNAEQTGMEVPANFWEDSDTQWSEKQAPDGGWSSDHFFKSAPSDFYATAAGFLVLSTTSEHLFRATRPRFHRHTGNYLDRDIEPAANWLNQHSTEIWKEIISGKLQQPCQTLWWLDQVMTQAGAIRLNNADDITHMLQWLLDKQKADGSWPGELPETAYAVRVLKAHLQPACIAKLAYGSWGSDGNWNQRPHDTLHLSRWLGRYQSLDSGMRCLVVDIDSPQEDLNAVPILLIAGDSEFRLTNMQENKLRHYVEQGGLIIGNADLKSPAFSNSFESLASRLFPHYEFRDLAADHPIFADETYPAKKWKNTIQVRGLSNGVRELMLLIPQADVSLAWQDDNTDSRAEAFQLFGNILAYANGQSNTFPVRELPAPMPERNVRTRQLIIARVHVGDNWDPEPQAWTRMTDIMEQRSGVSVDIRESNLEPGSLDHCKLAHLTGTSGFTLTRSQRQELHDFVGGGGTLLIDAAGGSTEFAEAAQAELKAIFGDDAKQLVEPMLPEILFAKPGGLAPLDGNPRLYRRAVQRPPSDKGRTPRLRVMKVANRMAVFFSREDLTSALAGIEYDSINGYRPEIGVELVHNILLYAEKNP